MQFSFGRGLLRAAVSLGFFGCLIAQGPLDGQAATSDPLIVAGEAVAGACAATPSFCGNRFANLKNAGVPPSSGAFAGSTCQGDALSFNCSDSILTEQVEIGLPDDFGVAFEDDDSNEIFRVDIQQRTLGIDPAVIGSAVASKAARNTRPNISPPLLV